ncbi:MAG: hypothetical protein LHW64_03040 [Candidatus Cloacimonetes bacterium]|jgi:hypothetical protein|nr:hypothetical protein [Candidatus Cloacimonadota bacterium]MCB5286764.1 hypothetical protein [Candidatus Cloacimonadota bacterium]MCK9184191.1 hypothetical protein [Candidatus Cloacimonadota bacterium]MCK9583529.1 hypothetical protein [Candidatus Cloacimonadota bacterium]MDY0229085.1 glycosyltransferase [Candidatus Cloacimonadaceae bacterium]
MKIALYASSHGFGHASRIAALADSFIRFGIYVYLCTDRPRFLFQELKAEDYQYREISIDRGVVHGANLVTDLPATKKALLKLFGQREEIVAREVEFLRQEKIDLVIADIPFFIVEACGYAEVPVFGVSNFDWAFIYGGIFSDDEDMLPVINTIWGLYRRMDKSYLLDLGNKGSVPGFKYPVLGGLLTREKSEFKDIRTIYDIDSDEPILLMMFGGEGTIDLPLQEICKAWNGVVMSPYQASEIGNLIRVSPDEDFLSLMHAADLVICKPGYSTFSEILSLGKSMICVPRKNYPEEEVLLAGVEDYPPAVVVEDFPQDVEGIRELFAQVPHGDFAQKTSNSELAGKMLADYLKAKYPEDRLLSVCDLGSNNMNYILYNKSRGELIHRSWCSTYLGKDIADGVLSDRSLERAFEAIQDILNRDRWLPSEKILIATGVNRVASNASELLNRIKKEYQYKTKIISAKTEMHYAWQAALPLMKEGMNNLVIDIGGASTELAWKDARDRVQGISLDFGLQSLLRIEEAGKSAILRVKKDLEALPKLQNINIIAVGLTATVLARVVKKMDYRQILSSPELLISLGDLGDFKSSLEDDDEEEYKDMVNNSYELITIQLAAMIMELLLDRYGCWDFMVCNDGISIGYAKWIK